MFSQNINQLPIPEPTPSQESLIENLSQSIQQLSKQRYTVEQSFRRRLPDLCPPDRDPKLNKKMQAWWLLDFPELQKIIKTQFKTTIPLAERNEWEDYFNDEKEKIAELGGEIHQLEQQLNSYVYQFFRLTPEEIELIERSGEGADAGT